MSERSLEDPSLNALLDELWNCAVALPPGSQLDFKVVGQFGTEILNAIEFNVPIDDAFLIDWLRRSLHLSADHTALQCAMAANNLSRVYEIWEELKKFGFKAVEQRRQLVLDYGRKKR
jgi:hypothetical protein